MTMGYLQPTEYASYGLTAETGDEWVTVASTMIDSYCRRPSLNPTQYVERLRIVSGAQTVLLSYRPLVIVAPAGSPLITINARYARPRRGEMLNPMYEQIAWAFTLPGTWTALNVADMDFVPETGELTFPLNILGLPYNEVEVTYMAGLPVIPDSVKVACAQIVKNAQATPALNVQRSRMDTMQMTYFSDSLMDSQVQAMLRPFVAYRMG
jgi:hypothetical protein